MFYLDWIADFEPQKSEEPKANYPCNRFRSNPTYVSTVDLRRYVSDIDNRNRTIGY